MVAPGSIHTRGRLYEWEVEHHPEEISFADLPTWILNTTTGKEVNKSGSKELPDIVIEGGRNVHLTSLAGTMRRKGMGEAAISAALIAENLERCNPPLSKFEVKGIAASVSKYDPASEAKDVTEPDQEKQSRKTQSDMLIEAALNATLFHDEHKEPYAVIWVNNHNEVYGLNQKGFKHWLRRQFYEETGKTPNNEAMTQAINLLEAKALYDGPQFILSLRVAERNSAFYYDLANDSWQAVRITPEGWECLQAPFVLRRSPNMATQVTPLAGGKITNILDFVNLKNHNVQILILVYLVTSLIPGIPHPVPVIAGEKGAAKSTTLRVLRKLIDPAIQELLSLPNDKAELPLLLSSNYAPYFDNLDGLSGWQSDLICRASTGGSISKRKLFTDNDEVILNLLGCVALNGINPAATRPDLLDRSITFILERIPPSERKTEAEFWEEFESARPYIFGSMLDILSKAMKIHPTVNLKKLPRMADFCKWGYAVAEAAEIGGEIFLEAYWESISQTDEAAIQAHPVASAVTMLLDLNPIWQGTPTALLNRLEEVAESERINTKANSWPKAANALTRKLNEIRSNLLDAGIFMEETKTTDRGRKNTITLIKSKAKISSNSSEQSESLINKDS